MLQVFSIIKEHLPITLDPSTNRDLAPLSLASSTTAYTRKTKGQPITTFKKEELYNTQRRPFSTSDSYFDPDLTTRSLLLGPLPAKMLQRSSTDATYCLKNRSKTQVYTQSSSLRSLSQQRSQSVYSANLTHRTSPAYPC